MTDFRVGTEIMVLEGYLADEKRLTGWCVNERFADGRLAACRRRRDHFAFIAASW